MTFYADLHIHSKYSRATSRESDLEHMAVWARKKGVSVLGTGDFTHPAWFAEIQEKLVPAEPGLLRLRDDLQREVDRQLTGACQGPMRYMLQVEISTIYKKGDRTRKVHHIIYVPDFDKAGQLIQRLSRIGNLKSDGRPILGLDSRDLLEITLECGEGCYLVPAHIWTPWFAVLGSKSGFDSVEECYGDLSSEIFALETGLSSDPAMNWRLSQLDRYRLVSNSDAHSPPKIAREACVFDTQLDYFAMRQALRTGEGYRGTVEFFPEEGKYHLDGHRKCGVRLSPDETREKNGQCPVCGKALTVGVMNRVEQLADRPDGSHPDGAAPYRSLVPLAEVIAEIRGVGEKSKRVRQAYEELIAKVGSELFILEQAPVEELRRAGATLLAEAVERMRQGRVVREAGFDGEYGTIRLFAEEELAQGDCVSLLFDMSEQAGQTPPGDHTRGPEADAPSCVRQVNALREEIGGGTRPRAMGSERRAKQKSEPNDSEPSSASPPVASSSVVQECPAAFVHLGRESEPKRESETILDALDSQQRAAAETVTGPLLIVAGPGTGKTRTLTHRIADLVAGHGVAPEQCLAITFSRRAAAEMAERVTRLLPGVGNRVSVMTFHSLGLAILREHAPQVGLPKSFRIASDLERRQLLQDRLKLSQRLAERALSDISRSKRGGTDVDLNTESGQTLQTYQQLMQSLGFVDFDDLIGLPKQCLCNHPDISAVYRERWQWVSVDEYQDIDDGQYGLLRQLVMPDGNLCAIGDPDQSIYGFRGSDVGLFQRFTEDFAGAKVIHLTKNYRSSQTIVSAALQVISPSSLVADRTLQSLSTNAQRIEIRSCATDRAEAEFVVHTIERAIGGTTMFSRDSGRVDAGDEDSSMSFGDFAVLYRTEAQAEVVCEALARSGIPFQKKSHGRVADQPAVQAIIRSLGNSTPPGEGSSSPSPVTQLLKQAADAVWDEHPEIATFLAQLHPLAEHCGDDLNRFLTELAMGVDCDLWDPRADRVSLLTLHAAKGLEFPVVFLVGCEDGVLPLHWGKPSEGDIDEERRLFFVGMTRARERLYLSHARKRMRRGKVREMGVSPFVREIEEELLERTQTSARSRAKSPTETQLQLFDQG